MKCPQCPQQLETRDAYCRRCGCRVDAPTVLADAWPALVVEALPNGVFIADAETKIRYWNRAMEKSTAMAADQARGTPLLEALPQLAEFESQIGRVLATSTPLRVECGDESRGRESFWLRPLVDERGVVGLIGLVEDPAERIRLDTRLIRSERLAAIGELAAGVAHNFNNILAAIGGDAQLLKLIADEDGLSPQISETAEMIYAETMRGGRIANDLLSFARGSEPRLQIIDVAALIDSTVRLARNHPAAKHVTIEQLLNHRTPPVEADSDQLHQVFFNIILNALQAMPSGGILTITGDVRPFPDDRGAMLELKFSDTGTGIPEAALSRIFDPFFSRRPDGSAGSGLGLPVSLSMVRSLGGDIRITSAEGLGTVVTIALPIVDRRGDPRPSLERRSAGRVLVVDDEDGLRRSLTTLLVRRGYEVGAAADGEEALQRYHEAIECNPYDLVLIDLMLPRLDGICVTRSIRARSPRTPIVVLSGLADQQKMLKSLECGAQFAFNKPVNFAELLSVIDRLAERRSRK